MNVKEVSIETQQTQTEQGYDEHYQQSNIEGYFNLPQSVASTHYKNIISAGFKNYPKLSLSVSEQITGEVYTAQQLSTEENNYLKYAYPLIFVGVGPLLNFEELPEALSFGTATIRSYTQEIRQSNSDWQMKIVDNRLNKTDWEIQAKVSSPFQSGTGKTRKELRGAKLQLKDTNGTVSLNNGMQPIYKKSQSEVLNIIKWDSSNGFFLNVPPGIIEKDTLYQTTIDFVLSTAP